MLGPLLRALQHTLRALMRLLRTEASPGEAPRSPPGAEAPGAALCDGDGWQLAYEDPLEFPSATLKSAESRCAKPWALMRRLEAAVAARRGPGSPRARARRLVVQTRPRSCARDALRALPAARVLQ